MQVEATPNSDNFVTPPDVVDWSKITLGLNDNEHTATLTIAGLDASRLSQGNPTGNPKLGDQHFTHLLEMLSPNKRVRIGAGLTESDPLILFQGYPLERSLRWSGREQVLTVTCISEGDEFLALHPECQVFGQVRRGKPWLPWNPADQDFRIVDAIPLVFNPGGKPNRSAQPLKVSFEGHDHYIYLPVDADAPQWESADAVDPPGFVGPPTPAGALVKASPVHWSAVNALRYLCAWHIWRSPFTVSVADFMQDTDALIDLFPQPPGAPGMASDPFVGAMVTRLSDLACHAMNAREALVMVCQTVGLNFQTMIRRGKTPSGGTRFALRVFAALQDAQEEQATPSDRRMVMPKVRDLPRQAPFTDQTGVEPKDFAEANKAGFGCDLTLDVSNKINLPQVKGGIRTYECSLLLRPGWKPSLHLDNLTTQAQRDAALDFWETQLGESDEFDDAGKATSIYHGQHLDHRLVSDVGRLWIFPDTLDYTQGYARNAWHSNCYQPYVPGSGATDGASIYQHSVLGGNITDPVFATVRRRPFRDTIARAVFDSQRAPYVRICFDFSWANPLLPELGFTGTWRPYAGKPVIDTERAALRFDAANMLTDAQLRADPNDTSSKTMLEAIINGTFAVEVTCCIEGDTRIEAREFPATNERLRSAIVDVAARFQHLRRRGQNSLFDISGGQPAPIDEPAYEAREDDFALADFAAKLRRRSGFETASASIAVPWLDADSGWEVGDACKGCSGIDINFATFSDIVSKTYSKDSNGKVQTTYQIGDLRFGQEFG